jgi:antitoxin component of MazEF toxin-antitoxin module
MRVLKVRRVGNSNVIAIPRELERLGYRPGASVVVDEQGDGSLRIVPAEQLRDLIRQAGRQVVAEDREALDILAKHDQASGRDLTV